MVLTSYMIAERCICVISRNSSASHTKSGSSTSGVINNNGVSEYTHALGNCGFIWRRTGFNQYSIWDLFYQHALTLIHAPKFGYVLESHTLPGMRLLIHAGFKVNSWYYNGLLKSILYWHSTSFVGETRDVWTYFSITIVAVSLTTENSQGGLFLTLFNLGEIMD